MRDQRRAPVVVGVDGSASALEAVRFAAAQAERHGAPLRLVAGHRDGGNARSWLRDATQAATLEAPSIGVDTTARASDGSSALIFESQRASQVVVGYAGSGGITSLLGSTATSVVAHARCPVIVVRGTEPGEGGIRNSGPVIVGVDGSQASEETIGFAFEEASLRETGLAALHVWSMFTVELVWQGPKVEFDSATINRAQRRTLAEQFARWHEKYPDIHVDQIVMRGSAARSMLDYGAHAQLIVVGSRGRGGFTGMLLGSTSQALITRAPCPVAVVRSATAR
ncbi:MAG: universal stress protein [Pseudonocardiaceae bacterium]|nr:universal stress protein [Pseudonocardiaceae bacterium]